MDRKIGLQNHSLDKIKPVFTTGFVAMIRKLCYYLTVFRYLGKE